MQLRAGEEEDPFCLPLSLLSSRHDKNTKSTDPERAMTERPGKEEKQLLDGKADRGNKTLYPRTLRADLV